tara:strand:+ start:572 stop:787 length:216 start_codon:yes stop_codon:yes gene_type:complete
MNITTVVEIIKIEKHIDIKGVISFREEVVEVFDNTKGSFASDICQKALERCRELNEMYGNAERSYVTNRVD